MFKVRVSRPYSITVEMFNKNPELSIIIKPPILFDSDTSANSRHHNPTNNEKGISFISFMPSLLFSVLLLLTFSYFSEFLFLLNDIQLDVLLIVTNFWRIISISLGQLILLI